jgi:hypothetical protein
VIKIGNIGYLHYDWTKVIFSDEACIYDGPCGRVWCRREPGEQVALLPENCIKKAHHQKKLNIIGFISSQGNLSNDVSFTLMLAHSHK